MLPDIRNYDTLRRAFRWQIPPRFNIADVCCDRWAAQTPDKPAIIDVSGGSVRITPFGGFRDRANRLANVLVGMGIQPGDRVGILLPQTLDAAIAHIAIYKTGAIAVPLALLFGIDAIEYRLVDAGIKLLICNGAGLEKVSQIEKLPPAFETILCTDGAKGPALDYAALLDAASPHFSTADTGPDDPALMVYTSGTTGAPKGALHGHRVLLGHLPGTQLTHDFLPQPGDILWTPADWAWAGGLLNILLPGLYFGLPVVACAYERFDPEAAYRLMEQTGVRNAFIPPTALRMMRAVSRPQERFKLSLRSIASAGEALGAEVFEWAGRELGLTVNEFYGQTECNQVLGSCGAIGLNRAGSMGRPVPGHDVAIIRADGSRCDIGETGQIVMKRPDPIMFLGYWNRAEATRDKFIGDWMTTGDQGYVDQDGFFFFVGRDDDVITSSGYRIGPGEIEDCLISHPAVTMAAAVGKPDELRTEIVKAFIVLREGFAPGDALAREIQTYVRERLSAHEYPREIEFTDELPMTTTGKIIRRLLRERG
ncbi:MAG: AMP-binding protein [Beijerinckiaceae bacterium]|jgi:acetyl-CoA synthetase|nr:AMP-binding protein [Beijerinckiaceae bacterium]